ncbi:phage holin family protein [Streptomyces sp. Li-HN-5-11]|uniref:phage holin family protein n=1 Tax=Streptomyces sp. Li-HN-5-11 TaxID=3075432 RepID=UPI0028B0CD3C|nr:phage holin family protein [Streptomyces sp. Li-HN-5-11]WNM32927.1 phage holin family protein [Streptomyces sp. Li-HN-5-11]
MRTPGDEASSSAARVSEAAARLGQDAADLARREVRAVQGDLMAGLRRFEAGGALLGGAGVCGILAVWAAHETVLRGLERVMPRGRAAAVLTCAYGSAAAALAVAARDRVNAAADAAADALEKEADGMRAGAAAPRPEEPGA